MSRNILIVGAGINGLVASNYLRRAGNKVTLIEKKPSTGGACAMESFNHRDTTYHYPSGASVLGLMQDFVFDETGQSHQKQNLALIQARMRRMGNDKWYRGD